MDNKITMQLSAYALAAALDLEVIGEDLPIKLVAPLADAMDGCLCFSKKAMPNSLNKRVTVICSEHNPSDLAAVIISKNPRLDFARALAWIEDNGGISRPVSHPKIDPTAKIGDNVVICDGASIGAHTVINHNVVIGGGVTIGNHCVVKSGAVIGEDGFGFERDESGIPVRLVHLGGVQIGDHVEIGSFTTVCRGTLRDTVIEDHVKIDDHVHIAHNVRLRRGAMIVACAEVSGGVDVGEMAWIGPNASVIQQRTVGASALVGIAANVIRDVPAGAVVAGNPARPIEPRQQS
jgi:UDP-3-O-[3-hydroxymyristoyl] glucosamine N-acyltransferase